MSAVGQTIERVGLEKMLRDAGNELSRVLVRCDRRTLTEAQRHALVDWAGHLRITRGLSANTGANYIDDVGEFFEWLNRESVDLERTTAPIIERWVQELAVIKRDSSKTRGGKLTAVRRFFVWRESQTGELNPARSIAGPRREQLVPVKYSKQQMTAMFNSLDISKQIGRRDFSILLFIYVTGARRMEVASLTLPQIELHERHGRVRFRGKGNKERIVEFGVDGASALQAWLADRDGIDVYDTDALWVGMTGPNKGKRLGKGGIEGVVSRAIKKAKLKSDGRAMGVHRLRSTFATDMYDQGYRIEEIQLAMGHNSVETTRQYIAITERQRKVRMPHDRIGEVLGVRKNEIPRWLRRKLDERGISN